MNLRLSRCGLALALGLALAPSAQAELRLSADGLGDALYLPYYTVDQQQASLLTISNAGTRTSAVQVLFAESDNGQNVMSFAVFLPPDASWSAALGASGDGAVLSSSSAVCSLPSIPAAGVALRNFDYATTYADGGSASVTRTRSGAVEIIELGTVAGALAESAGSGGCAAITTAFANGWSPAVAAQFSAPGGAISAQLQVVQVAAGLIFQVPGIALRGFADRPLVGNGVAVAGEASDPFRRLTQPLLPGRAGSYWVQAGTETLEVAGDRAPDAISLLFMQAQLGGEFYTAPALGAETRWVVAFPTKHAYVHRRPGSLMTGGTAVAPFASAFGAEGACEAVATRAGRLSGRPLDDAEQPFAGDQLGLCRQVNPIDFAAGGASEGRVSLRFADATTRVIDARRADGSLVRLAGLPAVGLQLSTFVNGQAQPGVLANYSVAVPLRGAGALRQ